MISKRILRIIFRFSPVIAHSIECNLASDDYLKANCYGSHRQHIRDEMYRRKLICISCSVQDPAGNHGQPGLWGQPNAPAPF